MQPAQVSPGVIIKALQEEIVNRQVRIRTLEDNVTALQLQIEPLNEENRAFRAQVAWGQVNAMKQQEQLLKLAQVNQSLTAEIQGLRHALFNLSQENTNLRMRLDSTRAPVPQVTTQKASGKAGNAKLQATTASSVPQQQELPPPVPVTVLVQQESEPVHAPTQPEQKVEPAKVELEPQAVPVTVMARQEEPPVQQEVQEEPPVQPVVQETPVPVSTAEEIESPKPLPTPQEPSRKILTDEERKARNAAKRAREQEAKAKEQAVRELQEAQEARVAAEKKAEAARAAAEKKAQKEAVKQAEAREKERKARETQENARRAREKAEKRMQAQLAREEEERILELEKQAKLDQQEKVRQENEAQAKKDAEKEKALLAEAEKEGERLEKNFQPSMHHSDCDQELAFALLVGIMKENNVKDPIPKMQTFLKGMTPAKTLEYICRALFELDTPQHVLRYDEFKGVSCKISVGSILDLRAAEQYKKLVTVRQALDESDLWQLTIQFNNASRPFYSPKVPLETISHWLDSKKLSKVIEEYSAIQTEEVDKCKNSEWVQNTIGTVIENILAHNPKLLEDLKTNFDPAGDETDYWGMKKVQITYKKRSSDGTAKTVTKRMTRIQLIDWYLLGTLSVLISTSYYLPC